MKTKILLICALAAGMAGAQTFEVAAIHQNITGEVPLIHALPGGGEMSAVNTSLLTLIRVAYRVGAPQISGPEWMSAAKFDITAKGEPTDVSLAIMAPKIRALLADRFGLVVHEETVMQSAIVIGNGSHLTPSAGGDAILHTARTSMVGNNIAMGELLRALGDATGDIYVDESGFTGRFDVAIRWSNNPVELAGVNGVAPALSTVLHEKYGLTVTSRKVPVTKIVVDKVNRTPTEN